jgi:hypothetical protein
MPTAPAVLNHPFELFPRGVITLAWSCELFAETNHRGPTRRTGSYFFTPDTLAIPNFDRTATFQTDEV